MSANGGSLKDLFASADPVELHCVAFTVFLDCRHDNGCDEIVNVLDMSLESIQESAVSWCDDTGTRIGKNSKETRVFLVLDVT